MAYKIRTFIAFGIPASLRTGIAGIQERLKAYRFKVRWVRPESIHLTLKFIGDIEPSLTMPIADAMEAAARGVEPISLAVKGIGAFPNLKRPKVIWSGLAGDLASLNALQGRLESEMASLGFSKEKRAFKGHLTIGRAKGRIDPEALAAALRESEDFDSGTFVAGNLVLLQSDLRPTGAVYTELVATRLGR
jgi:RNA 2',3'-cyclic 3'-phosphodiesterase